MCPGGQGSATLQATRSLHGPGCAVTHAGVPRMVVEQKQLGPAPHPGPSAPGHVAGFSQEATQVLSSQRCRFGQQRPAQKTRFFSLQRLRLDGLFFLLPTSSTRRSAARDPPANPASTKRRVTRSKLVGSMSCPRGECANPGLGHGEGPVASSAIRILAAETSIVNYQWGCDDSWKQEAGRKILRVSSPSRSPNPVEADTTRLGREPSALSRWGAHADPGAVAHANAKQSGSAPAR